MITKRNKTRIVELLKERRHEIVGSRVTKLKEEYDLAITITTPWVAEGHTHVHPHNSSLMITNIY